MKRVAFLFFLELTNLHIGNELTVNIKLGVTQKKYTMRGAIFLELNLYGSVIFFSSINQ